MPSYSARFFNTTRRRVFGLLGLVLMLYVLLTLVVLRAVVFPAFERLELADAIQHLERVEHALQAEQSHLADFNRDWAFWDDAYLFAASHDPEFTRLNLTEDATANTPTDLIAVFDASGAPAHIGVYRNLAGHAEAARALLVRGGPLFHHAIAPLLGVARDASAERRVLLDFNGTPLIAIAHPLLHSDRSGPSGGVFMMAKLLDADTLDALQEQTLVPFTLTAANAAAFTSERTFPTRSKSTGYLVKATRNRLSLALHLAASEGPGFMVQTRHDRQMTREGISALGYALLISSLTFASLVALIYRRLLAPTFLRPLRAMTRALNRIEDSQDLSARLPVQGAPELQQVAQAFNTLMTQVEADREEISLLSLTDDLTRLPNRRRFNQMLRHEWLDALRQNRPLAVLMCDIDHFKAYNDRYGHPIGDDCLRRVAQVIEHAMMRRTDFVARYGGEEFVLILPDTDAHGALTSAERILGAIRDLLLPHAASPTAAYVTASIGVYAAQPDPEHQATDWVALADTALYLAKSKGRNRAELAVVGDGTPSD